MANDPDLVLLQRFARGDDAALGELAARHERAFLGLAMGLLGNAEQAKDVVQDLWLRVIRSAAHFQGQSSVRTWMYRILVNRCLDVRGSSAAGAARDGAGVRYGEEQMTDRTEAEEGMARVRAVVSMPAPAAKGTIKRTGLVG